MYAWGRAGAHQTQKKPTDTMPPTKQKETRNNDSFRNRKKERPQQTRTTKQQYREQKWKTLDMRDNRASRDNREKPEKTSMGHSDMKRKRIHGGVPYVEKITHPPMQEELQHTQKHTRAEQKQ